jgi:hypothetical protein
MSGVTTTYNPNQSCPVLAKMSGADSLGIPPTQEFVLGKDDYGCELIVYGATSGAYMQWDESADDFKLAGVGSIQFSQTPATEDNWGVNQITVTSPGSSKHVRALRVNIAPATGGVTVGDMQAIHGRATISADDTTAANTSIHSGFFWNICENGMTLGTASIIAPVRAIFSPGTNDLTNGGDACAIFYGQTWATAGQIDSGLFLAAGAGSTIASAIELAGSGTFGQALDFGSAAGANDLFTFATLPTQDAQTRRILIYSGDSSTRAAVFAEVSVVCATGSLYFSSAGEVFIRKDNAGASTDWAALAWLAADTGSHS